MKGNMKFFSLEDSKKLVEMGCKSESQIIYRRFGFVCNSQILPGDTFQLSYDDKRKDEFGYDDFCVPAFTDYDFLADTEQALRNCEILWGDQKWRTTDKDGNPQWKNEIENVGPVWKFRRTQMLSSPDHIEFVKGFLK